MHKRILIFILILLASEVRAQKYPYTMQADASLLAGERLLPVPGLQVFNGIRVGELSAETGVTVGVDAYSEFTLLPVSASIRWMPFQQKALMPYLSLNAGYGLAWFNRGTEEKDYRGGGVINPSIGLRIKTKTKTRVNFGAGYKLQEASIVETAFDDLGRTISVATNKYSFGRISISFGVGF